LLYRGGASWMMNPAAWGRADSWSSAFAP